MPSGRGLQPVYAVRVRVWDLIREICGTHDVHILLGHLSKGHVYLLVSIPPQVAVSRLVQRLKGKPAYKLLRSSPTCGSRSRSSSCGRGGTSTAAAGR